MAGEEDLAAGVAQLTAGEEESTAEGRSGGGEVDSAAEEVDSIDGDGDSHKLISNDQYLTRRPDNRYFILPPHHSPSRLPRDRPVASVPPNSAAISFV